VHYKHVENSVQQYAALQRKALPPTVLSMRVIYLCLNIFLFALLTVLYILDNTLYPPEYTTQPELVNTVEEVR